MKLCKCSICGNIVEMIQANGNDVVCCNKNMDVLQANTSDGALEKHVPVAQIKNDELIVNVGSMAHPMSAEHFITMIIVESQNTIYRVNLTPDDEPCAKFPLQNLSGKIHIYEYCNLHGLWKTDIEV